MTAPPPGEARRGPAGPLARAAHAVAMAAVQELLIVALMFNPPHPTPLWVWALTLLVTPAAIIAGGYLR